MHQASIDGISKENPNPVNSKGQPNETERQIKEDKLNTETKHLLC